MKRIPILHWIVFTWLSLALSACAPTLDVKPIDLSANPSDQVKTLKESLDTARKDEVPLFAPTWFERADNSVSEASKMRSTGGQIESILQAVARGKAELEQAQRFAGIARKELTGPYQARQDAIASGAPELYGEDFAAAERGFRGLAQDIENENLSSARRDAKDVIERYRALELRAIKQHTLGEARRLIESASREGAKRYAPRTLKEAEQSLAATDQYITANPKATREIQAKAADTLRHAQHLQVVLKQVKDWERASVEDRVLFVDSHLAKIDTVVSKGEEARPVQSIADRFNDLEKRARVLVDNQEFLNAELNRVQMERRQEVAEALQRESEFQSKLAKTSAEEQRVAAQLKAEKEFQARFDRIRQLFTKDEAEVYRQGDDVLIRLKGLNFEIGKAYISPDHYPLLTKVLQASRIIDTNKIVVEGHTDTTGTPAVNQVLSKERAEAVKAYVVNNGGLSTELITAIGFGPDKPIAANTTADGRRLNRRTDVILSAH